MITRGKTAPMFHKSIIETIKSRKSCRFFDGQAVNHETRAVLQRFIEHSPKGPFGNNPKFHITSPTEVERNNYLVSWTGA